MNTATYDFVHLALLTLGGKVEGKTKLQKLIYFIGVRLGMEQQLGYRPHYYGPFSAEVSEAMDLLCARGFVAVSLAGAGALDDRGFELVRSDYTLTPDGRTVAVTKAASNKALSERIREAVAKLEGLKGRDYMDLSIMAKTYFMMKSNPRSDLSALAQTFGWAVTEGQIRDAQQELGSVDLMPGK